MSKTKKISDSNLEHIVLNDLKQADRDVFIEAVEHLYPVTVEFDEDSEEYTLTPTDEEQTLEQIFGDKHLTLFEDE